MRYSVGFAFCSVSYIATEYYTSTQLYISVPQQEILTFDLFLQIVPTTLAKRIGFTLTTRVTALVDGIIQMTFPYCIQISIPLTLVLQVSLCGEGEGLCRILVRF